MQLLYFQWLQNAIYRKTKYGSYFEIIYQMQIVRRLLEHVDMRELRVRHDNATGVI